MSIAANGKEKHERQQVPFQVRQGTVCGFANVDLLYESTTLLPGDRVVRQPMAVPSGSLATAILELLRLYNDLLVENAQHEKNYERDQRTIARLDGEVEKLKNQLRGHEGKVKKT